MPPTDLSQNAKLATLVFDNVVKIRTENHGEILSEQLQSVFEPTEYVFFASDKLDAGAKDANDRVKCELQKRIMVDATLLRTKNRFLLVFCESAETLTQDRLKNLLELVAWAENEYNSVLSLLCVDKTDAVTQTAMDNTLKVARELEGKSTSMLLFNTRALTSCAGNVRALVRYIHCISRDNDFANTLRLDLVGKIAHVTMCEFDVQGYDDNVRRLNEIEQELKTSADFPMSTLNNNFNGLVDDEKRRFEEFARNLTEKDVPVREAALSKRRLFKRHGDDSRQKLDQLEKTLEYTFAHGVWEPYKTRLEERGVELCQKLTRGIGVGDWPEIRKHLAEIPVQTHGIEWKCTLKPAHKMEDLRDQLKKGIDDAIKSYANAAGHEAYRIVDKYAKNCELWENTVRVSEERRQLVDERNKRTAQMYPGVTDARSFWWQVNVITRDLSEQLPLTAGYSECDYVLVNDDINKKWNNYAGFVIIKGCEPKCLYNCHKLDDQEFQVLTLKYFSYKQLEYDKNKVFNVRGK